MAALKKERADDSPPLDYKPTPFDDALRRILNAPPQPKKAKPQDQEKAKKKAAR